MNARDFPLSSKTKQYLLGGIFNYSSDLDLVANSLGSSHGYFCYYQRSVEKTRTSCLTDSHIHIANIVALLKDPAGTRGSIQEILLKQIVDEELDDAKDIVEDSINLAVRLLLMIPIGGFLTMGRSITLSGETKLNWSDGTIKDLVNKEFVPQNRMKESVKLEKIFNAMNLEQIAGVDIRWTSNLADHLRMRDDDNAVEIFHYATFLKLHQNSNILPTDLVEETLQTLALLLPEHDRKVQHWFSAHEFKVEKRGKLVLDPFARECGQLKAEERQIDQFKYWHDRLVILKQVFDEAEPSNFTQWWRDRRKHVQWYTFWVAVLVLMWTVVFGLVQCIEGALQVWLAFKASK